MDDADKVWVAAEVNRILHERDQDTLIKRANQRVLGWGLWSTAMLCTLVLALGIFLGLLSAGREWWNPLKLSDPQSVYEPSVKPATQGDK